MPAHRDSAEAEIREQAARASGRALRFLSLAAGSRSPAALLSRTRVSRGPHLGPANDRRTSSRAARAEWRSNTRSTADPRRASRSKGTRCRATLVERMKDAWVSAVFDGFLLDDLDVTGTRAQLTRDGYLRADVQATVVSEPDTADQGDRDPHRTGHALHQSADRLFGSAGDSGCHAPSRRARTGPGCVDVARPQPSCRRRSSSSIDLRGYLEAAVKVQAPVFTGQSAELPVQISEGRQYTIDGTRVSGATVALERTGRSARSALPTGSVVPAGRPRACSPRRRTSTTSATATTMCASR